MKLTFLGGADGVGASCTLVEMAGHRILVDCGIRQSKEADALPSLSKVQDAGGIEAIVLTHAHIDHSGALPVIYQAYPTVPIYLTTGTHSIATILLLDAVKIMQMEAEREGEVPLYSLPMAEMVIGAARPLGFTQTTRICGGDVQLTFYPAGHIMGAATALLESRDGVVLLSGDIAVTNQLTVSGMMVPRVRPDLVVIESTYGGRLHANRELEENRLIEQTAEVIARNGAILFPAFAVGRAQEVILILAQAMERGVLAKAPIFVDGMVRQVCAAYTSYPELLSPWFRKRVKKFGNPFFYQDGPAQPIWDARKREVFAQQRPAIFVASSGMLAGGPSQYYAGQLAKDPASFIAITGYQDEESPGRKIQEIAQEGGGEVRIGNELVTLQCGVGTYKLSAHADTAQIVGVLTALAPAEVALVHGDAGAREALALATQQAGIERVYLPKVGDEIEVKPGRRRRFDRAPLSSQTSTRDKRVEPLQAEHLVEVAKRLLARDGPNRFYTAQEILLAWEDHEGALSTEEIARVGLLLGEKSSPFKRDHKRFFLYRIRVDADGEIITKEQPGIGRLDQNGALQQVDNLFPAEAGLYHRGAQLENGTLMLSFYFPKVARRQYAELLEQLQTLTGWIVSVRAEPHQNALVEAALASIPPEWPLRKPPSFHLDEEKVVIHLDTELTALPEADSLPERAAAFQARTGFQLVVQGPPGSSAITPVTDLITPLDPRGGKLEINAAYNQIRQAFQTMPHQPLKTSLKGTPGEQHIEIAFISPEVGSRYQELLAHLAEETGWPLRLRPQPDQFKIQQLARSLVPSSWRVSGEPAFISSTKSVVIKTGVTPQDHEFAEAREKFKTATGYELCLKGR